VEPKWTDDDEKDVRFYLWGAGEAGTPPSNMGVQIDALQRGVRRTEVLPCCDPDGEMCERLDSAARAARVCRVLDALERSDAEVLVAAFGVDLDILPAFRARFGELAGVVVVLARGVDLRVDSFAAFAEEADARLEAAKQAYALAREQALR
jgi:hypothetical protein